MASISITDSSLNIAGAGPLQQPRSEFLVAFLALSTRRCALQTSMRSARSLTNSFYLPRQPPYKVNPMRIYLLDAQFLAELCALLAFFADYFSRRFEKSSPVMVAEGPAKNRKGAARFSILTGVTSRLCSLTF